MNRPKVIVSACLLGAACRYDGMSKGMDGLEPLTEHAELFPFCPEIYGGLPTPRPAAERRGEHVVTGEGTDVTAQYAKGAREALRLAKRFDVKAALLKERSPSCGAGLIHDGSFTGGMVEGDGVTAELFMENGVKVYGESRLNELINDLKEGI